MAVEITSLLLTKQVSLPFPMSDNLLPQETKLYPFVEFDEVMNDERVLNLIRVRAIVVESRDPLDAPVIFGSAWDDPNQLILDPYHFWVDSLDTLRIKKGVPTSEFDGTPVGATVPAAHGATHAFTGPDPIPRMEVLEGSWSCAASVAVLDVVYRSATDTVALADATADATMPAVGFVISKPTATTCIIARSGELPGFTGLDPSKDYFVSLTAGAITSTAPSSTGEVVQRIGYARDSTTLVIELRPHVIRA